MRLKVLPWLLLPLSVLILCSVPRPGRTQNIAAQPITAPSFDLSSHLGTIPASLTASGSWTSACMASSQARAFDVFAALAHAGTLQINRWADPGPSGCTLPIGASIPSTALALTTGGHCPASTNCGDVASNDGLPYLAFTVTLTDTSGLTNTISKLKLVQGAQ